MPIIRSGSVDGYIIGDDYISRVEALEALNKNPFGGTRIIERLPSADVERVKHGEWIGHVYCSCCGWHMEDDVILSPYYVFFPYCPGCGAKMDLKGEENE